MGRKPMLLAVTLVLILGTFVATLVGGKSPQLGLDLKGGISVRLFPVKGTDPTLLDTSVRIISNRVNSLGVAEPEVSRQGDIIVVDLPGVKDRENALKTVGSTGELQNREVLGERQADVPIPATTTTKVKPTTTTKPGQTTTTLKGATTTIVKGATTTTGAQVNGSTTSASPGGTTSGATTTSAAPTTTVASATTTTLKAATPTTVKGATTTTKPKGATTTTKKPLPTTTTKAPDLTGKTCKDLVKQFPDTWFWDQIAKKGAQHKLCYALGPNLLSGTDVKSAASQFSATDRGWGVNVQYKAGKFQSIATQYVNKRVAIVLDNAVLSAPVINQGITGDDVRITGSFNQGSAENLALALKYGSLPVRFDDAQRTIEDVSPTLGKDQLRAGIVAGIIGLAFVALYMLLFYRMLGLVVWLGLGLTGMVMYTLVSWFGDIYGVTLTLSGVTGIIVSVGVTVDSYVVYFERLKDEVRSGKTVRSSIESGWKLALRTIIAADAVSLIGAGVLYALTIGSVKGFAYFLALSTIVDLVLAWCFMHPLVLMMARRSNLVAMKGVGIASGLDVAGRTLV